MPHVGIDIVPVLAQDEVEQLPRLQVHVAQQLERSLDQIGMRAGECLCDKPAMPRSPQPQQAGVVGELLLKRSAPASHRAPPYSEAPQIASNTASARPWSFLRANQPCADGYNCSTRMRACSLSGPRSEWNR